VNVDSDSTWIDENVVLCDHLLVVQTASILPILGRRMNRHGRQNQQKAMANHPCQHAKKPIMNHSNTDN